jgi:hypothetical protein
VEDLTKFLKDERLEGIVSILCNTSMEIETVADILNRDESEFKNFTLYNPGPPAYSEPTILVDFVEQLRTYNDRRDRKGKEYCIIFYLFLM